MLGLITALAPILFQIIGYFIQQGVIKGEAAKRMLAALEAWRTDGSISVKLKQDYADLVREHLDIELPKEVNKK